MNVGLRVFSAFSYYLLTLKKSKRLITKTVRLDRWIGGGGIEINSHIKRF